MKRTCLFFFILVILFSFYESAYARVAGIDEPGEKQHEEKKDKIEPLEIGNFLLPTTQQPGPVFGFGQNIIDARDLQLYASPNKTGGHNFDSTAILPYAIYGITDYLSILLAVPVALNFTRTSNQSTTQSRFFPATKQPIGPILPITPLPTSSKAHSSGLMDMNFQIEYAYYNKTTLTSEFQTTVLFNISFPTGSITKNPPTGLGAPSFFLGTTANYQALFWYIYGSLGGIITTKKHGTRFGSSLLYQFGLEGIIGTLDEKKWIFAWVFELFGIRASKDLIANKTDQNSGGNTLFAAPSLWISSKHLIIQLGVGTPVYQKLNGIQDKVSYFLFAQFAWTFNLQ